LNPDHCADTGALIAGWYGKLPCLGDFASRRLPTEFIATWDAWLQRSIAASREHLRERWLDAFLTSPMWRFVLGEGVCGEPAWAGLLVPSVDKVGRYFPLTFALPLNSANASIAGALASQPWYAGLERAALAALTVDFSVDSLESELAKKPFPHITTAGGIEDTSHVAKWLSAPDATSLEFHLPSTEALESAVHGSAEMLFSASLAGRSLWWCVEPANGKAEVHCTHALPDGERYTRMLGVPKASADTLAVH
jgi:type VI secretion system protein ImpM